MNDFDQKINDLLLDIFDKILLTEEKALRRGNFSDISVAEMHTLESVGPYEKRTMSETAATLGVTTGTLTVAIDRLVRKGYVERHRDNTDRRVVRVALTRQGKLAFRMHNKFHKLLVDRLVTPLDEQGRDVLRKTLIAIDGIVSEQYERYVLSDHAEDNL
ncbi:MAG: MarR family winged helix-turn-helix transcriptional regulator [Eubacteriales bacterium]|nr:MarR family winged helix-turn-helix transcriptional regulator [Eubacteriales bacterium]